MDTTSASQIAAALGVSEDDPFVQIFQVPANLSERYAEIYRSVIERLRSEASGLRMSTMQLLLIERLASKYVINRNYEDTDSWPGLNSEKDLGAQWLAYSAEFSKVLNAGSDVRRDALRQEMGEILISGLELIPDPEVRRTVRRFYMEKLAAIGE